MAFPTHRPRRLRRSDALRKLVRETRLDPSAMIYPIFIGARATGRSEISSMPGQFTLSVDAAVETAREA
jgi:porphobilinogen synthase